MAFLNQELSDVILTPTNGQMEGCSTVIIWPGKINTCRGRDDKGSGAMTYGRREVCGMGSTMKVS